MRKLINSSLQKSTRQAYAKSWSKLCSFIKYSLKLKITLPISPRHVALYVAHLHTRKLRPSTIKTHMSAISYTHKIMGFNDPTSSFIVVKAIQGAQALKGKFEKKLKPITKHLLWKMIDNIPFCASSKFANIMYTALFLLAFHACLRAGEVVQSSNKSHTIQIQQVTTIKHKSRTAIRIQFKSYKHSKNNTPVIHLLPEKNVRYCPVRAIKSYIDKRGQVSGPLFIHEHGKAVSRNQFSNFLKDCITMCGLQSQSYNTHSFRIGRATQMARDKVSEAKIKATGRWRSSAYVKYIRPDHISLSKLS